MTTLFARESTLLGEPLGERMGRVYGSIAACDFTGYDPGTLYYTPTYLRLLAGGGRPVGRLGTVWNRVFQRGFRVSGRLGVWLTRPAPVRSTKAVALCVSGLAALSAASRSETIRAEGRRLVDRLLERRDPLGWWRPDFRYVIRGTTVDPRRPAPCLINSVFACQALLDWAPLDADRDLAAIARSTALALVASLPRHETAASLCVTYHPDARYYVHNANLLLAGILAQVGEPDGGPAGVPGFVAKQVTYLAEDLATRALVPYAGEPTPNPACDNYHTGFVLRALTRVRRAPESGTSAATLDGLIQRVWSVYREHFFDADGVYRFVGRRVIQAHSLAEALLVYATCPDLWSATDCAALTSGARRSLQRLWRNGQFINEAYQLPLGLWRRDVTPMPRWSWSWMFLGLAALARFEAGDD